MIKIIVIVVISVIAILILLVFSLLNLVKIYLTKRKKQEMENLLKTARKEIEYANNRIITLSRLTQERMLDVTQQYRKQHRKDFLDKLKDQDEKENQA